MTQGTEPKTGGCMCGSLRYQVSGTPFWVGHCHCKSCRRHTGAPVVTFVAFKNAQVVFTKGTRQIYRSSPGVGRAFCGQCDTPLTWEGKSNLPERGEIIELYISTFDDPNTYVPTNHVWYQQKVAWFDVADDLPRYRGFDFNGELYCRGPA